MTKFFINTLLLFALGASSATAMAWEYRIADDSIGIERRNNRVYILHRVEAKETLNAISERYGVSLAVIRMVNALTENSTLKVGQILRVPLVSKSTVANSPTQKRIYTVEEGDNLYRIARDFSMDVNRLRNLNSLTNDFISKGQTLIVEVPIQKENGKRAADNTEKAMLDSMVSTPEGTYPAWVFAPAEMVRIPVTHVVKKGQTLYQISDDVGVSLDSLRIWNNLTNDALDIDDVLIVGYRPPRPGELDINNDATDPTAPQMPENLPEYRLEKGIGMLIPRGQNEKPDNKNYGLHTKAAVGSYVKVKNPSAGGRYIYVKIIGRLSSADQEKNIVIKLNEAACKALGIVNERFPIEIYYHN